MTILATFAFSGSGTLGANWTDSPTQDGAWTQGSGVGAPIGTGHSLAHYTAISAPADQYAQVKIASVWTQTDEGCGPTVRGSTASYGNVYLAQTNTTETRLYKRVSSTYTQLGSDAAACAANDILYVEAVGTSITVKKNGSTIIGPVTDSEIASGNAGLWGVFGGTVDDFEVGDFVPTTADQEGARFGNDDGAESAHTWYAAQDTDITAPAGETHVLNMIVNATGTPGAKTFKLQYRKVGDGAWRDMPVQ